MAATGATASAGVASDAAISAVEPLESSAVDMPLQRTQTPAPLHRQLLGPIASLAAGPNGERTLSVNIAPEALGPITVKALLGGEGIRMELSAPTDAGREALRAMLPELRRELAATGSGTIMLSTGTDSSSTPGGHTGSQNAGGGDARSFTGAPSPGMRTRGEPAPETPGRETALSLHDTAHLDVMA
ncbi:flagellar hook-length control protein FliK [Paeniglutamicibacter sp. ZC-3]|uniref:flagellar hook-length control protein FliK n=1 Tax=Paeniglutamicibacter sp. ZC-3 TaxID=2986919 RepID=UPI0021F6CCFE|nr:flagellar hook-length control protein FliK [Paeniglutamicibacter sp. ZC-3]MCV9996269.1 flagellar hook-length control protein FliK [Paeniglutamicibacter sp. ZC-3]